MKILRRLLFASLAVGCCSAIADEASPSLYTFADVYRLLNRLTCRSERSGAVGQQCVAGGLRRIRLLDGDRRRAVGGDPDAAVLRSHTSVSAVSVRDFRQEFPTRKYY